MLSNFHIFLLSVLQGITEFLPVSSSGHLILFSKFTTFPDQGLALDVAVHVGSILAVMIYFSEELWKMFKGLLKTYFIPTMKNADAKTFWLIVIGTIPIVIVGLLLKENGMEWLRSTKIIGWTILGYGLLLFVADKFGMTIRKINHLSPLDAFLIGCAQCLALIPGTSRSGVTITMARFLSMELYQQENLAAVAETIDGITYSFISSIIAIYIVMWWLKKSTFLPFVIYRILLGSYLILDSYGIISINM